MKAGASVLVREFSLLSDMPALRGLSVVVVVWIIFCYGGQSLRRYGVSRESEAESEENRSIRKPAGWVVRSRARAAVCMS